MFVVVKAQYMGYDPSSWSVYPVGRGTAQRVYTNAVKSGWHDPYFRKDQVVGRFDTVEAAKAYIQQARTLWDGFGNIAALRREMSNLHDRVRVAERERSDALKAWIAATLTDARPVRA